MDSDFSYTYFPFILLAFRDLSSLRTQFWPFTRVLSEIRSKVTRKSEAFRKRPLVHLGHAKGEVR